MQVADRTPYYIGMESTAASRRTPLLEPHDSLRFEPNQNDASSSPSPRRSSVPFVLQPPQGSPPSISIARRLRTAVSFCRTHYFHHSYRPPIFSWIRTYASFSQDAIAGVTVGLMLVPQSMSYATLAGLPVVYGLYSSMVPLYCYSMFGSSRHLAVGPVAMVSLLLHTGLSEIISQQQQQESNNNNNNMDDHDDAYMALYEKLALQTSFLVGLSYIVMGLLRLGTIVNFLSHTVISGFTTGAAIIIGFSQLKYILGFDLPRSDKLQYIVWNVLQNINQLHVGTFCMGIFFLVLLTLLKQLGRRSEGWKWAKSVGPLLVTVSGVAVTVGWDLSNHGIAVVGEIPRGLPSFTAHKWFPLDTRILPTVLGIVLVGFAESIAISKQLASLHGYTIDASDELIGLGISNLCGGAFQAYPITGSFSRSAVNNQSGAQTPLTGCFSATVVLVTVLFLTPVFQFLPLNALAAIVISGVAGLLDIKEARHLWRTDKVDFVTWTTACMGTLFVGVELGLGIAVLVSLIVLVVQSAFPPVALLGRLAGGNVYRNIEHYQEAEQLNGIAVVSVGSSLHFANIQHCIDRIESLVAHCDRHPVRFLILDLTSVPLVDSAAVSGLEALVQTCTTKGQSIYFANPSQRVVLRLMECECMDESMLFVGVHGAVSHCVPQQDVEEQQPTVELVEETMDITPTATARISRRRHGSST